MRADASRIGCASKKCSRNYMCLCVTNQKPISAGDEIYEIRTDDDVDTECDLPWTSKITSTTVFPNTSTSEPQYTTASTQFTTASSQYTTASPEYTTTSTKKAKSTIQCVTKTTKTPCATYPPHVKSERRARAANFREALSGKSKKHMTQKARKTQASGRFQNASEEKPLR
ncbi:unnamed protein product [Cylicocyclus nassatus]|uniref:Uncharacterized protein n=1 Tax=Cylicocyclus nassatus TaxID=53992 RepID=A0AA36H0B5_CYLNA|nr:unnamed protein product [Cylicocyclus nassatus]